MICKVPLTEGATTMEECGVCSSPMVLMSSSSVPFCTRVVGMVFAVGRSCCREKAMPRPSSRTTTTADTARVHFFLMGLRLLLCGIFECKFLAGLYAAADEQLRFAAPRHLRWTLFK